LDAGGSWGLIILHKVDRFGGRNANAAPLGGLLLHLCVLGVPNPAVVTEAMSVAKITLFMDKLSMMEPQNTNVGAL
jgi:hypothetical protein